MFTPKPQEYTDPLTGEMKKKQIKFFPDVYKDRIGKSYNDYIAGHQMNLFEDYADLNLNQSGQYGQIYAEKFTSACLICKVFYGKMKAQ